MERWNNAEERLRGAERAGRKATSLRQERAAYDDPELLSEIGGEESLPPVDFSDTRNTIDAEIAELDRALADTLGGMPKTELSSIGDHLVAATSKKKLESLPSAFPRGASSSDEWAMAGFREESFRTGMYEYLKRNRTKEREAQLAAAKLAYVSALEREKRVIFSQGRADVSRHQSIVGTEEVEMRQLMGANPEVFVGAHLRELRKYHDELDRGRLVETPYVKEQKQRVVGAIRVGAPIFIHGHLGAGKTELALAAARSYLSERPEETVRQTIEEDFEEWQRLHPKATESEQAEMRKNIEDEARGPLIISGSKETHQSEFFGHRTLSIRNFFAEERVKRLNEAIARYEEWEGDNSEKSAEAKGLYKDGLLKAYLDEGGGTFSDFFLGPVYRAMKQGRPVIIDEADAIPHEVLITLNHFLTRKPGETISVQQDSGEKIRIKRGYDIILTGNFPSEKDVELYLGRQPMDAAFLSRLEKLEYEYLPQSRENTLSGAEAKGELVRSELFHVLLAKAMDRYGNMELPDGSIEKLWKLAVYAKKVQDIFSGKMDDGEMGVSGIVREAIGREVLSLRHLDRILEAWKNGDPRDGGNMRYELDHVIFEKFVSQAGSATERMALYKIGQDMGLFASDDGWEMASAIESGAGVARFEIVSPRKASKEKNWYGPRDTVEIAFGAAPERMVFPVASGSAPASPDAPPDQDPNAEQATEMNTFTEWFDATMETLEKRYAKRCQNGTS